MFSVGEGDLSLYLHVPMCRSRCSYCAFYSEPKAVWATRIDAYTERLVSEIEQLPTRGVPFHTLYIGGGDPANLGVEHLRRVLAAACREGRPDEVTLEVNPESFDERFFPLFADRLVTRLSMGIQTMDQRILTLLGRSASVSHNRRALALAREARLRYGIDLSIDMMLALPTQTVESALADIEQVLSLCDCEHLSLYCLTVEEGTALARQVEGGSIVVLDEDGQEAFLRAVWAALARLGFEHYEVSNFARNRRYSRHNSVYWRLGDYLGLGSGASSTLGSFHWQQSQDLAQYADGALFSGYEREETTRGEQVEEYLMMGLRTGWGIDKALFSQRFGYAFDALFAGVVAGFEPGWYVDSAQSFVLTEDGWMVLDEILVRLVMEIPESLDRVQRL